MASPKARSDAHHLSAEISEVRAALQCAVAELDIAKAELIRQQSFADAMLDTIDVGIVTCDAAGGSFTTNRAARSRAGVGDNPRVVSREEAPGVVDTLDMNGQRLAPQDYPLIRALRGEDVGTVELLLGPVRGPHREHLTHSAQIVGPDGVVLGAVSAVADISAERAAARGLIEAQRIGQLGSFSYDMACGAFTCSEQLLRNWGLPPDADLALASSEMIHGDDRARVFENWDKALTEGGHAQCEHRIVRPDGQVRFLRTDIESRPRHRLTGPSRSAPVVLAVLAMSFALIPPAGAATTAAADVAGSIGIRLVDAPVMARDDPRARVYIVDHLEPGTTIKRRIEVSNTTRATTQLTLYAAAASITKGSFLGAAAHTPNDLTSWTTVTPGKPEVRAGGKLTATVTIAVPKDAAPGEQYGVVWAEARSAPKAGGGVTQVSRVGIRLYISVGPGGPPAANFAIDSLTAERSADGRPVVVAAVHNTGGRALDMNGTLHLGAGPGGLSAGPFPATLGVSLGISDTEPVTITLDKQLPAGPWDATITLHSGLLDRTATASLTFPDTGAAKAVPTPTSRPIWRYLLGAGLLAVLLAFTALVLARRRRRREPPADTAPAQPRQAEDAR